MSKVSNKEVIEVNGNGVKAEADIRIVILPRGNIMIGVFSLNPADPQLCNLTSAAVIRIWGTTHGLGQIAHGGPTKDTVLDPTYGDVEFHRLVLIASIKCNAEKWYKPLGIEAVEKTRKIHS